MFTRNKIEQRFKTEKEYNQYKVFETQNLIWDWQFKRFKNRVERERYRNEYDAIKAKLESLNNKIKAEQEKPTMPEGDIKRLDDDKVRMEADLNTYKGNMDMCDNELNGVQEGYEKNDKGELVRDEKGMPIHIEAQPGIEQMIQALRDLMNVYIAYIKIL